jgi:site-specific recombinase XerD
MSIKTVPNGYMVDSRPQGRNGRRIRKSFKTKGEALQFEKWVIATQNSKDWKDSPRDTRYLTELIELWYHYHGRTLKSGKADLKRLHTLDKDLGYPRVYQVTINLFVNYRAGELAKGNKATTVNRTQAQLGSVFTVLIKANEFHSFHPLKGLAKLKIQTCEMGFLSREEIKLLLDNLNGDMLKVAKLCLSTGARWSEAINLKGSALVNGRVIFHDTKNGKMRTVPVSTELFQELYNGRSGKLFSQCYDEFYNIIKSLNFNLPRGQATHVLRHSFASHFMMNGGNILTLQKILGHATVLQTMTYAHLAPDYLQDAVKFNPLSTN